jgi:hypothetical protein
MPWVGYVADTKESVTDFLDRFCYQTASTLVWKRGLLQYHQPVIPVSFFSEVAGGKRLISSIDMIRAENMLLDESFSYSAGLFETATFRETDEGGNTEHYEYKALYLEVSFGAWEDPFSPLTQSKAGITIPKGLFKKMYHYDLINDSASARFAVSQSLTAGHPSAFAQTTRQFSANMELYMLEWQAMDKVRWRDLPFFTQMPTPDGRPVEVLEGWEYPLPENDKQYLLNGFMVIDEIRLKLTVDDYTLTIAASQAQPWTQAKVSFLTGPLNAVPDVPPDPPNDPDSNPGEGSTTTGSFTVLNPKTWEF